MGFKNFVKPDTKKIILSLFVFLFAPLPFFAIVFAGFISSFNWLILIIRFFFNMNSLEYLGFASLSVLGLLLHYFIYYLIVCYMIYLIKKIPNQKVGWLIIAVICTFLLTISFIEGIYIYSDVGGGIHKMNFPDVINMAKNTIFQ